MLHRSPLYTQPDARQVAKDRLKIMITQQRQARQDFGGMNYHDVKRDVVAAVSVRALKMLEDSNVPCET